MVMTIEEYRAKYGRDPEFVQPNKKVVQSAPVTKNTGTSGRPGARIGESLVQAGTNIKNLVTGGREKFEQGLNEGNRVNVPALIGDYAQSALTIGGAALPIMRAGQGAGLAARAGAYGTNAAIGAGAGYVGDVGSGLASGETGREAFKPGLGTAIGAVTAPGLSAITSQSKRLGDVPGELVQMGSQSSKRKADSALFDLIKSEEGKRKAISAFRSAGQEGGVAEIGRKKTFKITPTKLDRERMDAVRDIVKPGKSSVENNIRLNNEILRVSKDELEPFLQANPRAFNVQTINSRLAKLDMPDLFKADETLNRTYNLVRQRMVSAIDQNPKTMEGLWKARKQFDQEVQDQFGDAVFNSEKNTAIKRAIRDMRKEVNDYIADEIGGSEFKDYMKRLNNIYSVRDNVAEKAYRDLNTDKYSRFWKGLSGRQKALLLWGGGIAGTIVGGKAVFAGE